MASAATRSTTLTVARTTRRREDDDDDGDNDDDDDVGGGRRGVRQGASAASTVKGRVHIIEGPRYHKGGGAGVGSGKVGGARSHGIHSGSAGGHALVGRSNSGGDGGLAFATHRLPKLTPERREALAYYEQKVKEAPDNFRVHHYFAPLLLVAGQPNRAIHHYRRAIELNPNDCAARNDLAVMLFKMGKWEGALAAVYQVLRDHPDHVEAHTNASTILFKRGQYDMAYYHARKAVDLKPTDPSLLRNLARVLDTMGNTKEAIKALKVALKRGPGVKMIAEPRDIKAYRHLSGLLIGQGGPEKVNAHACMDAHRALAGKTVELENTQKTSEILEKAGAARAHP